MVKVAHLARVLAELATRNVRIGRLLALLLDKLMQAQGLHANYQAVLLAVTQTVPLDSHAKDLVKGLLGRVAEGVTSGPEEAECAANVLR